MDFYFEEINKEVLQRDILSNQDNESLLSVNNLSMQYDILYLICNVPFFNAASLYEIFAFCEKKNSIAKMVERLLQKGYVKTLKVPKHSDNYTTLFYITDKGHQLVSSYYPNCLPYKKKSGKNLEKIGINELIAAGYVSSKALVKILGNGELKAKLTVEAHAFSKSAEAAIVAVGGSAIKL